MVCLKAGTMFIHPEKIAPPSNMHTSFDNAAATVRLKSRSYEDDLWVQTMIENLAGYARKIGMGKTQRL